jgi:hypothetical protein
MSARRTIAIAIAAAAVCAACGAIVGPDAGTDSVSLFDRVWSDFDRHYSLFVVKGINWDSLRAVYRPQAAAATSDEQVSQVISRLLANLQDDHVTWRGGRVGGTPRGIGMEQTEPELYVQGGGDIDNSVWYGRVGTSIGYIDIPSFDGTGWLPDVDSAMTMLDGVTSVIIDLRNNQGGLLENALAVAGRFAERTKTVAFVRYRNGIAHSDFTSPIAQQVSPAGRRQFHGRIFLLTSRNTVSAAELFVMAMSALGHTTVVGDTTAGETGAPFLRELQNGWTYQFPESVESTIDGRVFEGIGLAPDQPIKNDERPYSKPSDLQLERAVALALVHGRSTSLVRPATFVRPQNAMVRSSSRWMSSSALLTPASPIAPSP